MLDALKNFLSSLENFLSSTGIFKLLSPESEGFSDFALSENWWMTVVMMLISFVLIYLAIGKQFEPLLLLPIAIGMLLTNLPGGGLFHMDLFIPSGAIAAVEEAFSNNVLTVKEIQDLVASGIPLFDKLKDFGFVDVFKYANVDQLLASIKGMGEETVIISTLP